MSEDNIEIPYEDLQFLQELCNRLNTQDNRGTAQPVAYVIRQKKRRPCWEEQADGWLIHDTENPESCWYDTDTMKELKEFFEGIKVPWSKIKQPKLIFDWLKYHAPKEVEERFDIIPYANVEELDTNVFLTEEAINKHLESNYYHYTNADTYGIHLWRNPEMEKLLEVIFRVAGVEDRRQR